MIYTVIVPREDGKDEIIDFGGDSWSAYCWLTRAADKGHAATLHATPEPLAPSKFRESQQGELQL
jgi:hypothetical protein